MWRNSLRTETRLTYWKVGRSDTWRSLHHETTEKTTETFGVDLSPDGRLAACASDVGVQIWDLSTGTVLAVLPTQPSRSALFHPDGKRLLVSGFNGFSVWTLPSGSTREGKPSLQVAGEFERMALLPDGKRVVLLDKESAQPVIVQIDTGQIQRSDEKKRYWGLVFVAASPDGRWIATGRWRGRNVLLWETRTLRIDKELELEENTNVAFSPNGRWLVTGNRNTYRFWSVDSWKEKTPPLLEGGAGHWLAFAPEGPLLAVGTEQQTVELLDSRSRTRLATLQAPLDFYGPLSFSRDGLRLVVTIDSHTLHVWDLHLLRQKLDRLGLDWK